jgi:alkaline phosphatase
MNRLIYGLKGVVMKKQLIVLVLILIQLSGFGQSEDKKPINVILMIGDGMGLSQLSSAYFFGDGEEPNFSRFPFIGLHKPYSARQKITDSAAGATAFAAGEKTYNGAISVDVEEKDIQTIGEICVKDKIPYGLIATSSITHATPACFYAHAKQRSEHEVIASYLPSSGVDFFAGGGAKFFADRSDSLNLIPEFEKAGFEFDTVRLSNRKPDPSKKYGYLLAPDGMPSKVNGRDDFLLDATNLALDYFSQKDSSFFLMIEGSQIDWECHAMNKDGVIAEVNDFNKVIGAVLDFAEKDGNTLVIVTADHETGGFALAPRWNNSWNYSHIDPTFYSGSIGVKTKAGHTGCLVPVFAFGPGAEKFAGVYENTAIFHRILALTGW